MWKYIWINFTVRLVHTTHIDLAEETNFWWFVWVVLATFNSQFVKSFVWGKDTSIPIGKCVIISYKWEVCKRLMDLPFTKP